MKQGGLFAFGFKKLTREEQLAKAAKTREARLAKAAKQKAEAKRKFAAKQSAQASAVAPTQNRPGLAEQKPNAQPSRPTHPVSTGTAINSAMGTFAGSAPESQQNPFTSFATPRTAMPDSSPAFGFGQFQNASTVKRPTEPPRPTTDSTPGRKPVHSIVPPPPTAPRSARPAPGQVPGQSRSVPAQKLAAAPAPKPGNTMDIDSDDEPVRRKRPRKQRPSGRGRRRRVDDDSDDDYDPGADAADAARSATADMQYASDVAESPRQPPPKRRKTSHAAKKAPAVEDVTMVDSQDTLSSVQGSGSIGEKMSAFTASAPVVARTKQQVAIQKKWCSEKPIAKRGKKDVRGLYWYKNPADQSDPPVLHSDGGNPSQLRIPAGGLTKLSPGHQAYWEIKKNYFDSIVFYKVGRFYEIFYKDAEICHAKLDLNYMKDDIPHVGFPEKSFTKFADGLVKMGYKVVRIEQTQTAEDAKAKKQKCVNRDVCEVHTPGTLCDMDFFDRRHQDARYLLSICERQDGGSNWVGVCYVDCSTAKFYLGQFADDPARTRLRTLLAQIRPYEILYPLGRLELMTLKLFKSAAHRAKLVPLTPDEQFRDAPSTLARIQHEAVGYWGPGGTLPQVLATRTDEELTFSALGGCLYYLERNLLADQVMSQGTFSHYDPTTGTATMGVNCMILGGPTLANLEIINTSEGGNKGSLMHWMDKTQTPFGKRLLEEWIKMPLLRVEDINGRLDAIDALRASEANNEFVGQVRGMLKSLPDLERLLSRIHAGGRNNMMDEAVLFDNEYGKKQVRTYMKVLDAFHTVHEMYKDIAVRKRSGGITFQQPGLEAITTMGSARVYDYGELLEKFHNSFDRKLAEEQGFIAPRKGIDAEYDKATTEIEKIEADLEQHMQEIRAHFGQPSIKYRTQRNTKYMIEMSLAVYKKIGAKNLPKKWDNMPDKKGVKRFHSPEIKEALLALKAAQFKRDKRCSGLTKLVFRDFSSHGDLWKSIVQSLAELDCLMGLTIVSEHGGPDMCRPQFLDEAQTSGPVLELVKAGHPMAAAAMQSSVFVPNDTHMGTANEPARFLIVTGPNMGGKSTILRQTCICAIIAQIGCYVPAESCRMTPIDRIFTRIGANDMIMAGKSTFMVELEETSNILRYATRNSLVILDELGRGTSTFDGTSIAYGVAKHLAQKVGCRTMFSTHYHTITQDFVGDETMAMYRMGALVQGDHVTFLYNFEKGVCSNSYGMNCARLANLPASIITKAAEMSRKFREECSIEKASKLMSLRNLSKALESNNLAGLKKVQRAICAQTISG